MTAKIADSLISVVEEQETKMNSTHPNSQRNIGSEAYSKWQASEKTDLKSNCSTQQSVGGYSLLICRKVSGFVNVTG